MIALTLDVGIFVNRSASADGNSRLSGDTRLCLGVFTTTLESIL
jgi:hypothetical protein